MRDVLEDNENMGVFKKLSIKIQLFLLISCIIAVVLFVIYFIYNRTSGIVTNTNKDYTNKIIYQIKNNISSNCNVIDRISYSVVYNKVVQQYLLESDAAIKYSLYDKLINFLSNMIEIKDGIIDIAFISEEGNSFDMNGFSDICGEIGDIPFMDNKTPYYTGLMSYEEGGRIKNCIIACSNVVSVEKGRQYGQKIGTVYIVLAPNAIISEDYDKENDVGSYIYLMDRNRNILFNGRNAALEAELVNTDDHQQKQINIPEGKLGKTDNMIQLQEIEQLEGWIVCITPMQVLLKEVEIIKKLGITVLLLALTLIAIPFRIIANNIIRPMKKFIAFMTEVKQGNLKNLKKRIHLEGYAEINAVAQEFNSMLDEIDSLTRRLVETNSMLYKAELENKQSELAFLRSQINPHFLYNTFESFKGMASAKGVPEIKQMLTSLSNIFKYSVRSASLVLLREEIEIVKSYISIQQIRFCDRFDVFYEFEEDILDYKIPKMILQPIVENSVFHGLEPKLEKGHLWIGGRKTVEDELIVWVRDDGIGLTSGSLRNLSDKLNDNSEKTGEQENSNYSVGLKNVSNRIKLMYGKEYGIEIASIQGEYTQVLVRIPVGGSNDF